MNNITVLILGPQFALQFANTAAISYEQFCDLVARELVSSHMVPAKNHYQIYLGQGLDEATIHSILQMIATPDIASRFSLINDMHLSKRAYSHAYCKNSVISQPERVSEYLFQCALMLGESDTPLGLNIPAMVLVDAAIQLAHFIATQFFSSAKPIATKQFTIHHVNVRFAERVMPLDVALLCEINQLRQGLDENFKAEATIQIVQNKKILQCIELEFSLMDKDILLQIDNYFADLAFSELLNSVKAIATPCAA